MILLSPTNKGLNPELILLLNNKNHKIQAPWWPSTLKTNWILLQVTTQLVLLNCCATLTSQDHCTGFEGCKHLISIATEHLEACCLLSQPFSCSLCMHLLWFQATAQNSFVCKSLSSNSAYRALLLVPGSSAAKNTLPHYAYLCFFSELSLSTSPLSVLFSSLWLFKRQENTWRIPEQVLIKPNVLQSKITGKSPASSHERNPVALFTEGTIWCFKRSVKIFSCLQSQDDHCNGLTFVTKVSSIFVLLVATVLGWEEGVV